eukprot:gene21371-6113_t
MLRLRLAASTLRHLLPNQCVVPTFEGPDVVASIVVRTMDNGCKRDSTPAVQAALDLCSHLGCGTVYAPKGCYRFDGSLLLPDGVSLQGDWLAPDDGQASTKTSTTTIATSTSEGTVFHIYQIESENAGLEGTDIHFTRITPAAAAPASSTITPATALKRFPPTIS